MPPAALADLLALYRVELVKKETEKELRHRLRESTKEGEQRRRQAQVTLSLISVTYVALLILASVLAVWGEMEQQKWALSALMTILGSVLGYLVGQRT